ncbi:Uncharacterized protein OBRU01_14373 [Operophtera brumata]|uniref:EF-hand domain-containing protein n=1 Tax=Operophtera brumata TaxID=104452 RepID=A0A0L7L484_OPEBR|nr:Uncharacterized protein OBRU01_14373 [Operophtera brumata]
MYLAVLELSKVSQNHRIHLNPYFVIETAVRTPTNNRCALGGWWKLSPLMSPHICVPQLTSRERRFIKFASVEYGGQLYMTPQDFLESVVEQEPRQPASGFHIAFNMFDTDGNQRVDKNEFLVIQRLLGGTFKERKDLDAKSEEAMEKIFSYAWRGKRGISEEGDVGRPQDNYVHFFGKKGKDDLKFDGFRQFMENLQTEILLRYTYLDTDEYDMYLDRLLDRMKDECGITFDEFKTFCQFLNNLEDFTIAMRMYTLADHPISKDEFHRAVKICTGISQSAHLVSTVFAIFDADGDGLLSYKEFIAIMKDRLHRGFKSAHLVSTVFAIFDADGDGLLSYKEFIAIMKDRLHRGFKSAHLVSTVFAIFDADGDRLLSYKEFIAIMKDRLHRGFKSAHLVSTVFAIFDADGDGLLSYKEFIAIMKDRLHRGFKSAHLVSTVFAIFDADGDGLLSYKEFIAIMKDRLHRGFKIVTDLCDFVATYNNIEYVLTI